MSASPRVLIDLALAVLPKFVAAARVQGSLWKEKPKLRTFYGYLTANLVAIHEILGGLGERHDSVLGQLAGHGLSQAVEKLLLRLERMARTTGTVDTAHPFPKLQILRAVSATTSSDSCGLRRMSAAVLKDHRAKLLRHVDNSLASLGRIVMRQGELPTAASWQAGTQPSEAAEQGPASNQGTEDQAPDLTYEIQALHRAMATRWPCSCWTRHGALLRLTSFYTERDISACRAFHMKLLFSRNSLDSWTQAQIRLERRPAQVQFDLAVTNPAEHADYPLTGTVHTGSESGLSTDWEADEASYRDIPVQPGSLCRLMLACQRDTQMLYLLARRQRTEVHLRGSLRRLVDFSVDRLIPLSSILNDTGSDAFLDLRQDIKERLVLANILATAVLYLCASPWAQRQWVKERLCLALSGRENSPTDCVVQLYLKSDLDEHTGEGDYYDVQHPCPVLVDLGVLLVELELGKPIQELAQLMVPGNQVSEIALDRTPCISLLERVLRSDLLSRTFAPYQQAIWACYDCRSAGGDPTEIQQWIKDKICGPLSQLLSASFQIRITSDGIQTAHNQFLGLGDPVQRNDPPAQSGVWGTNDRLVSVLCQSGQFLDCERSLMADDASKWAGADDWFETLQRKTHSHFVGMGVTRRRDKPIKIAILDTGIDAERHPRTKAVMATNPQLRGSSNRIKGLRSWANDKVYGEDVRSMKDEHGHGTHAAGLILQVTPFADIYVAQVTNGVFFEADPVAIAEAIKYSVEDWGVDIISMSFGFDDGIDDMAEAIDVANAKGVIMVAAASNGGKIKSEGDSYPASSVKVISIRSANGSGRASEFNPDKPDPKTYSTYFNVVGEYVLSAWPTHLEPSGEKRASGTSVSTPIAAGVVALMLDYIWVRLCDVEKTALFDSIRRTPNATAVRTALSFMTGKKDKTQGLYFLKPWLLMSDEASARWKLFEEHFKIA
ncbi:hypothetical protein FOPE_11060 [Fonsecaea pedrosoi]|nr:hypothetical protein FOPE_11060 [Fonsecaea pedrosoi]